MKSIAFTGPPSGLTKEQRLFVHKIVTDFKPEVVRHTRGVGADEVQTRFAPDLQVIEVIRGRPDRQACCWYLLQKK